MIERKLRTPRILHISSLDQYSPLESVLLNEKSSLQIHTIADTRSVNWAEYDTSSFDAILVTVYRYIDKEAYGNMLANFVDRGGNVVLCLFSNSTSYTHPTGRFAEQQYHPLVPAGDKDIASKLGTVYEPWHPIMKNVKSVSLGSDTRRTLLQMSTTGNVLRIADWADGHPMVAVRTDKKGIVTSITYSLGVNGGKEDAAKLVVNALLYQKD